MERTEVERSSNLEPGGRCPSRSVGTTWTGLEPLSTWGLQGTEREAKEDVADRG